MSERESLREGEEGERGGNGEREGGDRCLKGEGVG